MTRKRIHAAGRNRKIRAVRATKLALALSITLLLILLAIFVFKPGEAFWPGWLIGYSRLFNAIFVVMLIFLSLMSPIIIEVTSNPRPLSGPGNNPENNLRS